MLLAKITMVFYSVTKKKRINLMLLPKSSNFISTGRRRILEEGIDYSSFFNTLFLSAPTLIFRSDHCHAYKACDQWLMSEIYVSKEFELWFQVTSDSNSRISLFLELLKLTIACQVMFLVKEICSVSKRCKYICK